MVVLVVGATGLLGQALVREASGRDHMIVGSARTNADLKIDVRDEASVEAALDASQADTVVNCAAVTSLAACEADEGAAYMVNARAVAILAAACKRRHVRFVHVSTDHYFSGDTVRLHDEDEEVTLLNAYARTKFAGEAFAMTCPGALVVRTNFTGFRGWKSPTFLEWVLGALKQGEQMTLFEDFYTSTIDAATLARAILDLASVPEAKGVLNVAASDVLSKKAFVEKFARELGYSIDHARGGSVSSIVPARAESLGLAVGRAEALLGYRLPNGNEVVAALAAEARGMNVADL